MGSEEIDSAGFAFPAGWTLVERIARKAENAGQFSAAVGSHYGAESNDGLDATISDRR